ncbi:fungal specific transcription factor domain-containing protein [Sarocladium implicatum]|nr:fungal specific transcription factor domain-containing protein [Sarocladium implicatum]
MLVGTENPPPTLPSFRRATTCDLDGANLYQARGDTPPEGGFYAQQQARLLSLAPTTSENLSPPVSAGSPSDHHGLPPLKLQLELIDLYFSFIHDQFHSLFHRPTFIDDAEKGRIPTIILFAIFSLSSRFSTHDAFTGLDPSRRGETFRVASEKLLDVRDVSIVTIQTCTLLGAYAAANGEIDVENLYYNLAGRISLLLDLPNQPYSSDLERELHTRTWWTLCMVDVWSSSAVKLPRIMPSASNVALPMDELLFLRLGFSSDVSVGHRADSGASPLMAEMVRLNRVLSKVIDFNRRCVDEGLEGSALKSGVQLLSSELDEWVNCLPQNMRDTQSNLEWFASQGLGRMFTAVYLGYYHYGQLLHYQFLGADSSASTPDDFDYANRCKDYAGRLCDLVYRSSATVGCKVLYSAVAHIMVIASTVQIHTLLFSGDESEIRVSRSVLERNFGILLELRPYWTSVGSAMNRLQAFHEACLRSKGNSFVLDRWLLRFLIEFAAHMESEPRDEDANYQALLSLPNH